MYPSPEWTHISRPVVRSEFRQLVTAITGTGHPVIERHRRFKGIARLKFLQVVVAAGQEVRGNYSDLVGRNGRKPFDSRQRERRQWGPVSDFRPSYPLKSEQLQSGYPAGNPEARSREAWAQPKPNSPRLGNPDVEPFNRENGTHPDCIDQAATKSRRTGRGSTHDPGQRSFEPMMPLCKDAGNFGANERLSVPKTRCGPKPTDCRTHQPGTGPRTLSARPRHLPLRDTFHYQMERPVISATFTFRQESRRSQGTEGHDDDVGP